MVCAPELLTNEGDSLVTSIQLAQLSDIDIKSLIEVLIGKHSNPDVAKGMAQVDWTKVSSFPLMVIPVYTLVLHN